MNARLTSGIVACAIMASLWPSLVQAREKNTVDPEHYVHVYGIVEYYEWHEFSDGETLLIESGPIYGGEIDGGYTENKRSGSATGERYSPGISIMTERCKMEPRQVQLLNIGVGNLRWKETS